MLNFIPSLRLFLLVVLFCGNVNKSGWSSVKAQEAGDVAAQEGLPQVVDTNQQDSDGAIDTAQGINVVAGNDVGDQPEKVVDSDSNPFGDNFKGYTADDIKELNEQLKNFDPEKELPEDLAARAKELKKRTSDLNEISNDETGATGLTPEDVRSIKNKKRVEREALQRELGAARRRNFDPQKLKDLKQKASERRRIHEAEKADIRSGNIRNGQRARMTEATPQQTPEEKHRFVMESMLTFPLKAKEEITFYEVAHTSSTEFDIAYFCKASKTFALDVTVYDPANLIVYQQNKLREGAFTVKVTHGGEHKIILKNRHKFDVTVSFGLESSDGIDSLKKIAEKESNYDDETLDPSDFMIKRIGDKLEDIMKEQRYLRARNAEHRLTQDSTNSRVASYSFVESIIFILAAVFQNIWVQRLVTPKRVV